MANLWIKARDYDLIFTTNDGETEIQAELVETEACADFAHTTQHGAIPGKIQTKKTTKSAIIR